MQPRAGETARGALASEKRRERRQDMLHDLLILYTLFFRMGAVTFGGGYATLAILRREVVRTHQWLEDENNMD